MITLDDPDILYKSLLLYIFGKMITRFLRMYLQPENHTIYSLISYYQKIGEQPLQFLNILKPSIEEPLT